MLIPELLKSLGGFTFIRAIIILEVICRTAWMEAIYYIHVIIFQ